MTQQFKEELIGFLVISGVLTFLFILIFLMVWISR